MEICQGIFTTRNKLTHSLYSRSISMVQFGLQIVEKRSIKWILSMNYILLFDVDKTSLKISSLNVDVYVWSTFVCNKYYSWNLSELFNYSWVLLRQCTISLKSVTSKTLQPTENLIHDVKDRMSLWLLIRNSKFSHRISIWSM